MNPLVRFLCLVLIVITPIEAIVLRIRHINGRIQRIKVNDRDSLRSIGRVLTQDASGEPFGGELKYKDMLLNLSDSDVGVKIIGDIPFVSGDILSVVNRKDHNSRRANDSTARTNIHISEMTHNRHHTPKSKFGTMQDIYREKAEAVDVLGARRAAGPPVVIHHSLHPALSLVARSGGAALLLGRRTEEALHALAVCVVASTAESRRVLITDNGGDHILNVSKQLAADLKLDVIGCAVGPADSQLEAIPAAREKNYQWWTPANVLAGLKLSFHSKNSSDFVVLSCSSSDHNGYSSHSTFQNILLDAFRLSPALLSLHSLGALDIASQYSTLIRGSGHTIKLVGPQALVGNDVTSNIDASLMCVPCALIRQGSGNTEEECGTDNSSSMWSHRAMTHLFPALAVADKSTSSIDISDRQKKYAYAVVARCSPFKDVSDECWRQLYDPHLLLYMYMCVPEWDLVCNFVDRFSQFWESIDSDRSTHMIIELSFMLDQIKMQLEMLELLQD